MQRYSMVIKVKPEHWEEYKRLHQAVWPEMLKLINACNIKNYSLYYRDGYIFSYYEYHGHDYQADMAKMAADKTTQEWWAIMEPMQLPLPTRKQGEWWANMEEVFHVD